jgi:hypothetical protein
LQLTAVTEDHSGTRQMVRCRLRAKWSLAARLAFWSGLGLELLVIGLAAAWRPWSWLLLLTLPLGLWLLAFDRRNLQSVITVLLDELAREWKLKKIHPEPAGESTWGPR